MAVVRKETIDGIKLYSERLLGDGPRVGNGKSVARLRGNVSAQSTRNVLSAVADRNSHVLNRRFVMHTVISRKSFRSSTSFWSPKILGEINDSYIKAVKVAGEFVCITTTMRRNVSCGEGSIAHEFRDHEELVRPVNSLCVPRGVEALAGFGRGDAVLLFEPKSTLNTGMSPMKGHLCSNWNAESGFPHAMSHRFLYARCFTTTRFEDRWRCSRMVWPV